MPWRHLQLSTMIATTCVISDSLLHCIDSAPSKLSTPLLPSASRFFPVDSRCLPHRLQSYRHRCVPLLPSSPCKLPTSLRHVASPFPLIPSAPKFPTPLLHNCFPVASRCLSHRPQSYRHRCFPLLPWYFPLPPQRPQKISTVDFRCFRMASRCLAQRFQS